MPDAGAVTLTQLVQKSVAEASFYVYIDVDDSNIIKAREKRTGAIKYSHATDAGDVLNNVINNIAATSVSGGKIALGPGTFNVTTTIVPKNSISISGEGYKTILKLATGANTDVIKSFNFDTLTGTNSTGGVHSFILRDLTIDGNRAATGNTTGCGIKVYGYGHFYDNIIISDTSSEGIYSEWSTNTAPPSPHSMETVFNNVKVHGCDTVCIRYRGSHDSHWYNVVAYAGTLGNCVVESSANYDGGLEMHACHFWGSGAGVPSLLVTSASVGGFPIISEGSHGTGGVGVKVESGGTLKGRFITFANDVGIILNSQNNEIDVYSYGNGWNVADSAKTGIEVNSSFNTVRGRVENNATYGLNFSNGAGALQGCTFDLRLKGNASLSQPQATHVNWGAAHSNTFFRAHVVTDTGETAVAGTPNAFTNTISIYSVGAGTNYVGNRPDTTNMVVQNAASVAETLKTWQVADDTTSYLKLENASSTDAIFIPRLHALSNLASSSTALAYELRGELRSSSDTGTSTPVVVIDSRLHTSAGAVAVRDLFGVRNNGTNYFAVAAGGNAKIGANQRLILSESGLTAARTFTLPDISGPIPAYSGTASTGSFLKHDGTSFAAVSAPKSLVLYAFSTSGTSVGLFYMYLFTAAGSSTESLADIVTDYTLTVKRFRVSVAGNAKTGSCSFSFRDDGADVTGTALTATAGTTGELDSGVLSVDIAAGSKICGKVDTTAGGASLTLTAHAILEAEVTIV